MRFTQLRLVGFKSFVEATTLPIEPGLTGVVGPNGCGKSNLLEALRWVMGAASAKALRGEDMDDVIFGGSGERPARGHAEVTLSVETEGQAPEPFHAQPFLEVSRRIDRGAGSTYRINGSEARARDVQLLFADGSTGANSPALVRQGQISELIAARPQNRRRILEEAAGVSGLHGRRHEAEIKVRAAEANLARLSDLEGELESSLARLRREARSAAKYKKIAAEIRGLRAAILHLAWRQAGETERAARAAVTEAALAHEQAARAAAAASTEALKASEALAPLREEQAIAAAVHQRALLQREQVDRDLGHAREAIARADEALRRLHADVAREEADTQQAGARIADLSARLAEVDAAVASFPDREPALAAALAEAERVRAEADGSLERYLAELASRQAHRKASRDRLAQVEASRASVSTAAESRACRADAASRGDAARLQAAEAEAESSALAVTAARKALEEAEAAFAAAERREAEARERTRAADSALQEIAVELKALSRATAADGADGAPTLLTSVSVDAGYEAALAAALRDELEAGLAPGGRPYWSELGIDSPAPPAWPEGVVSLAEHVRAPPRLARRLRFIGVVGEASAAERVAATLAPGARLVSKGGGLWRWDGFVAPEGALLPAAVRLRDLARIEALSAAAAKAEPAAKLAKSEHAQAREALMRF